MSNFISVVIATHNGASTLPAVLEGYQRQDGYFGEWELIIVDNDSTDETVEVVKSFSGSLPLRLYSHDVPGKNRAMNFALSKAEGDLLVFSDDDAIPRSDWLSQVVRVANDQRDFGIFGGRIVPKWPSTPPQWIKDIDVGAVYVVTLESAATGPTPNGANIWGPNMAVRRSLFDSGVRFDEQIGPSADNPACRMGSKTEFIERMCRLGVQCWYCDDWQVEHIIHPRQFEKPWVLARAFRSGRGTFRRRETLSKHIGNTPRRMVRQILITYIELWKTTLLHGAETRFPVEYKLHFLKGLIQKAPAAYAER